jgi:hypothetical protein
MPAPTGEVNASPVDTKAHPQRAWSLPPVPRGGQTDRARFLTIGVLVWVVLGIPRGCRHESRAGRYPIAVLKGFREGFWQGFRG